MTEEPKAKGRAPFHFTPEQVRDISERVYRVKLEAENHPPGAVERMIAKDKDDGQKLRNRAGAYDALTRCYLTVLEIKI
jgi:hypothetical protein